MNESNNQACQHKDKMLCGAHYEWCCECGAVRRFGSDRNPIMRWQLPDNSRLAGGRKPKATKTPKTSTLASAMCYAAFDDKYPILAELGCGWLLVAHQNGPAIGKRGEQMLSSPLHTDEDTPKWVNAKAIEELMDWAAKQPTWPKRHNASS